jgi:hypothetical protein
MHLLLSCNAMQASAKLKAAEGAQSPSDRSGLVREALNILGRVPLCANLEFLSSQLAYLKAWDVSVPIHGPPEY